MILPEIKKLKLMLVLAGTLILALILSLSLFMVKKGGKRYTFVFPSVEKGEFIVETRRLEKSFKSPVEYYIDELMLGPQTERCRFIFPKETEVNSVMVKNKVLYINFSKKIVNPETEGKMLPVRQAIELFKNNVLRNFPSINTVEVFVEGNPAYEGY